MTAVAAHPPLDALLVAATAELGLDARAVQALREIPWGAENAVLWVPGTGERAMPATIRRGFDDLLEGVAIVRVPYAQTWHMRSSVPDGIHVLRDVLRGIAYLRARGVRVPRNLYVSGHSQGSWVGTNVLADRSLDTSFVTRALFFSNPGTNPVRAGGFSPLAKGPVGRVLELGHPDDPVAAPTRDVGAALDAIGGPGLLTRIGAGLVLLCSDPVIAVRFGVWQLTQRLLGFGSGALPYDPDPHQYSSQARDAVRWLRDGTPAALAAVARSTASWGVPGPPRATAPVTASA